MPTILRKAIREVLMNDTRPKLYILVGPPAIGKSTWVSFNAPDAYVINRDEVVDQVREPHGLRYSEMFTPQNLGRFRNEIEKIHREKMAGAVSSGKDIVVDMTNMGIKARRRAMAAIRGHESEYEKVAVVFDHRGKEEMVWDSIERRAKKLGDKMVPYSVVADMFKRFEMPTKAEGFDQIISADTSKAIGA